MYSHLHHANGVTWSNHHQAFLSSSHLLIFSSLLSSLFLSFLSLVPSVSSHFPFLPLSPSSSPLPPSTSSYSFLSWPLIFLPRPSSLLPPTSSPSSSLSSFSSPPPSPLSPPEPWVLQMRICGLGCLVYRIINPLSLTGLGSSCAISWRVLTQRG